MTVNTLTTITGIIAFAITAIAIKENFSASSNVKWYKRIREKGWITMIAGIIILLLAVWQHRIIKKTEAERAQHSSGLPAN